MVSDAITTCRTYLFEIIEYLVARNIQCVPMIFFSKGAFNKHSYMLYYNMVTIPTAVL